MRRWLTLIGITAVLALGLTVAAPPGAAQAAACINSLTCNPANLPLLVEAGIVTTRGGAAAPAITGTVGQITKSGGLGAIGKFVTTGGGRAGGFLNIVGMVSDLIKLGGTLDASGIVGQRVETDPTYKPEPANARARCGLAATIAIAIAMDGPNCNSGDDAFYRTRSDRTVDRAIRRNAVTVTGVQVVSKFQANVTFTRNQNAFSPAFEPITPSPSIYQSSVGSNAMLQCKNSAGAIIAVAAGNLNANSGNPPAFGVPGTKTLACGTSNTTYMPWRLIGQTADAPQLINGIESAIPSYGVIWDVDQGFYQSPPESEGIQGEMRSRVTCRDTDATVFEVETIQTVNVSPGTGFDLQGAKCPPGSIAIGGAVDWLPIGTETWTPLVEPVTAPAPITEMPTKYPDCFRTGAAPCALELYRVAPDGTLESCGSVGQLCQGWGQETDYPTRYQCKYGKTVIHIDHCSAYRDPTIGILPNVKPDGSLVKPSDPAPNPLPNPVRTPEGELVKLPDELDTPATQNCVPKGNDVFNPISWVMQPVQCALNWAFVPRQIKVDQSLARLNLRWQATTPAKYVTAVGLMDFASAEGCQGMAVDMSWLKVPGQKVFYFMPACPGDFFGSIAPLFKIFLGGSLIIGGFYAAIRQISGIFGYGGIGETK